MTAALPRAYEVVRFWHDAGPKRWFSKSDAFDAAFRARFLATHEAAAAGRPSAWADSAEGALALVLLLDQFPRNAFRGGARMFATDAQARAVASAATDVSFELQVDAALRPFFYMPFMHSELLGRASTPEESASWRKADSRVRVFRCPMCPMDGRPVRGTVRATPVRRRFGLPSGTRLWRGPRKLASLEIMPPGLPLRVLRHPP